LNSLGITPRHGRSTLQSGATLRREIFKGAPIVSMENPREFYSSLACSRTKDRLHRKVPGPWMLVR
jgi:hypothetical protein